jgi:hypothetical protein
VWWLEALFELFLLLAPRRMEPSGSKANFSRMVQIDVLEKPIKRIKETCAMMGIAEKFDRALPELETFLEGEVAKGETRETRLTYDGLCYLRQVFAKS